MDTNIDRTRVTLTLELETELFDALNARAAREGKPVASIAAEILTDAVAKQPDDGVHPEIMALYQKSIERFGPLYELLAK